MMKQECEISAYENNRDLSCCLVIAILKKKLIVNKLEM